jgi:hypothetical protein
MNKFFAVVAFLAMGTFALAQTVTVDNTNASPDNTTTFNSIMMALHSFQASGKITDSTDGTGKGKNHGNAAPNLIRVIATGIPYDEVLRVDERATSSEQNIQDEAFTIEGIASGSNSKPIVRAKDDGTNDSDGFEIRTDVNFEIYNMIFTLDPAFPDTGTGVRVVTIDRLTPTTGVSSTFKFQNCVFTGHDAAGNPLVTNKDEAFVDRTADFTPTAGGVTGRTVAFFPDKNEGMIGTFKDCVFYRSTNLTASRHALLWCYFAGTGVSADTQWTEEVGVTVDGCVFMYGPGNAIESQSGGNNVNASKQFINIIGENAREGGIAEGRPTVIGVMGNTEIPANGSGIYVIEPNITNSPNGAMSGTWNNLWIFGTTGIAIRDASGGTGGTFYWNLSDSLIFNNNLTSGGTAVQTGWRTITTPHPSSVSFDNVTVIGGSSLASPSEGTAFSFLGGSNNEPVSISMNNIVVGKSLSATTGIVAVRNAGPSAVTVTDSAFIGSGLFAIGAAAATVNSGTGTLDATNILTSDPKFVAYLDPLDKKFFSPAAPEYMAAGTGAIPIDGGRVWLPPPTGASKWSQYE